MNRPKIDNAPGLRWNKRKDGWVAVWQCRTDIAKRGYRPARARLWSGHEHPDAPSADWIMKRCQTLQAEMLNWSKVPDAERPDARYAGKGRIYFIDDGTAIKIGFSTNFQSRLATMQTDSRADLRVLALTHGTPDDERKIHATFGHLRLRGEWFKPEADLMEYIAKIGTVWPS